MMKDEAESQDEGHFKLKVRVLGSILISEFIRANCINSAVTVVHVNIIAYVGNSKN